MQEDGNTVKQECADAINMEDYLREHGVLTYSFKGVSMMPLLRQQTDLVTVARREPGQRFQKYDVILFRVPGEKGKLVLHRVIRVEDGGYVTRGDNCVNVEHPRESDVVGVLKEFHRGVGGAGRVGSAVSSGSASKGGGASTSSASKTLKTGNVSDLSYKLYSRLWVGSYPVRRGYRGLRHLAGCTYRKLFAPTPQGAAQAAPQSVVLMDELAPLYRQALAEGKTVEFAPQGASMRPMLNGGECLVRIGPVPPEGLKLGDVVLYQRRSGAYVLHRVVAVRETAAGMVADMCGDAQWQIEHGVRMDQVMGVLVVFATVEDPSSADAQNIAWTSADNPEYVRYWQRRLASRRARSILPRVRRKAGRALQGSDE